MSYNCKRCKKRYGTEVKLYQQITTNLCEDCRLEFDVKACINDIWTEFIVIEAKLQAAIRQADYDLIENLVQAGLNCRKDLVTQVLEFLNSQPNVTE